jgi:ParB-like chromosome segregation protein Spo0J
MPKARFSVHPIADKFALIDGDEFDELIESVRISGLREPIKLDHTGTVLVDGRNRLRACEQAGVEPKFERLPESTDLVAYIIDVNIHRRHLTTGQRAMLALDILPAIEEQQTDKGGRPQKPVADLPSVSDPKPKKDDRRSRVKAAKLTGTSGRAIGQAKRVAEHSPELARQVATGKKSLNNAEKQVKREKAAQSEAKAREAVIDSTVADAAGTEWRLLHGDFRERLLELEPGSVDLIVTDPPYPAEFLSLWSDLSQVAARLLKPQGLLVAMTGNIYLPEVAARLGEHLSYGWTYCQPLPGSNSRIMGRHILQSWKPWFVYSNGQWPSARIDWHPDMLDPSYRAKDRYRWEQDPDPVKLLIDATSDEGGLVLDPFSGTGAYGVAALSMGRRFIGVELDADRFAGAAKRLTEHG